MALREDFNHQHLVNTSVYAMGMAQFIYAGAQDKIWQAGVAGLLHDIGEQRIDRKILEKGDNKSREEWAEWKKHPNYGLEFLEGIPDVPNDIKNAIGQHHETFDGKGFPKGDSGKAISPLASLISLCDVFDKLTTGRVSEESLGPREALELMKSMQPGRFDPELFETFIGKI
jgi:HD-GYP domain-containing protein (c-di-GMP phosphodiesterase class II)